MLKIISWNVNGIRSALNKGFMENLKELDADILGVQEIKAKPEQLTKEYSSVLQPQNYEAIWNPAQRPGYSGTALFTKIKPSRIELGMGNPEFDDEGRVTLTEYQGLKRDFILMNIYYPNGQMNPERLDYKMRFYDFFLKFAVDLVQKGKNLIIMGDVNTAHREIDLKNPKENEKYSGFLPTERAWIDQLISKGFIDTFRTQHPEEVKYSWWTQRTNAREKNVGWRIDYVFVNEALFPFVKESFILNEINGSDHCPVGIILD